MHCQYCGAGLIPVETWDADCCGRSIQVEWTCLQCVSVLPGSGTAIDRQHDLTPSPVSMSD